MRLDDPAHPDNALFQQVRDGVHKVDAQRGRTPGPTSDNLAGALTVELKTKGMTKIDTVAISPDGTRASAIDGLSSPIRKIAEIPTAQGINTPLEQSTRQLAQATQAQQPATQAANAQQRTATQAQANGHNTVVTYSDGSVETRSGGTPAWRNNNPGNIRAGDWANNHGSLGSGAGGFAVFPDRATGRQAMMDNLRSPSYQGLTVGDAIARWAPAADHNDPVAYANNVQQWTGVPSNTPMNTLTPGQLGSVANAIERQEGWQAGQVTTAPAVTAPNAPAQTTPNAPAQNPAPAQGR